MSFIDVSTRDKMSFIDVSTRDKMSTLGNSHLCPLNGIISQKITIGISHFPL
jgi:hypothetical protein